jgi:hypothetical protein
MFVEAGAGTISVLRTFKCCNDFNPPRRGLLQWRRTAMCRRQLTFGGIFEDARRYSYLGRGSGGLARRVVNMSRRRF